MVLFLDQCDSIASHSKGMWGCACPLSLLTCQAQSVSAADCGVPACPPDQSLSLVGCLAWG